MPVVLLAIDTGYTLPRMLPNPPPDIYVGTSFVPSISSNAVVRPNAITQLDIFSLCQAVRVFLRIQRLADIPAQNVQTRRVYVFHLQACTFSWRIRTLGFRYSHKPFFLAIPHLLEYLTVAFSLFSSISLSL